MKQELIEAINKLKKPTLYFGMEVEKDTSPNLENHVGGKPYMRKGEKYPVCTKCKEKLNFILQLRIPGEEVDYTLQTFYYCFSCHPYRGEHGFEIRTYENPTMEESKETKTLEYIPYASVYFEPVWSLPDLNTIRAEHQDVYKKLQDGKNDPWDAYDSARSRILGFDGFEQLNFYHGHPQFIKVPQIPTCSCCKKQMDLWVQMDSNEELDLIWSNTGCLYIFKCEKNRYKILIQAN
jgi:uncharacterized protein YwqG